MIPQASLFMHERQPRLFTIETLLRTRSSRARHGGPVGGNTIISDVPESFLSVRYLTKPNGGARGPRHSDTSEPMVSPQGSTDLTMTEVRPPKFLTGIERFQACAQHAPNPGSAAGGPRCQPSRQTANGLSIWRDIRNLYFGITRHFSKKTYGAIN